MRKTKVGSCGVTGLGGLDRWMGSQTRSMADPLELVYEHGEIADLDPAERRLALRSIFSSAGVEDVAGHVARAADEIDGFGPISHLMRDETVTDILIDGVDAIW